MRIALATLAAGIIALTAAAEPARISRVIDGDTIQTDSGAIVRVRGVDAPERHGRCPAERRAAAWATWLTAELTLGETVDLDGGARDKYGRRLATVRLPGGEDLAAVLIAEGAGTPYTGGPRPGWCGAAQ